MESGGTAQQRRRFGCFIVVARPSGSEESKAVWRYRFPPHSMAGMRVTVKIRFGVFTVTEGPGDLIEKSADR